jgi:hypothetical protein
MATEFLITEGYRALNVELHERVAYYGTFGDQWADRVAALAQDVGATTVLDYGCGKGALKAALPDLDVREYDPAIPGKDALPSPADLVVCTDVLEHVEIECMNSVLSHIVCLAERAVLVCVSTRIGSKKLADGRPAHITVRSRDWWQAKLGEFGPFDEVPALRKDEYAAVMGCQQDSRSTPGSR